MLASDVPGRKGERNLVSEFSLRACPQKQMGGVPWRLAEMATGRVEQVQGRCKGCRLSSSPIVSLPASPAASLSVDLCPYLSAGPDVNPALVLEQKQIKEAATAKAAFCPKHSFPSNMTNDYVNYGFENSPSGAGAISSSLPSRGQEF